MWMLLLQVALRGNILFHAINCIRLTNNNFTLFLKVIFYLIGIFSKLNYICIFKFCLNVMWNYINNDKRKHWLCVFFLKKKNYSLHISYRLFKSLCEILMFRNTLFLYIAWVVLLISNMVITKCWKQFLTS